jgi:hypothetical protein
VELIGAVGLAGELVYPGTASADIWSRGELRPLPDDSSWARPAISAN